MTIRAKQERELLMAIPMRALLCNWVPVWKQELLWRSQCAHCYMIESLFRNRSGCMQQKRQRWETTQSHCARWKRTYVCPFLMRRMRNSFSFNSRTEWKRVSDNARTGTKVTKTGHFGELRIWGFEKNAPMRITMRGKILCAFSL